jgi:hypothetical protein
VDEGESTLDVCSKPHAPNAAVATRTASRGTDRLCLMVTNLSVDTRFSYAVEGRLPGYRGEVPNPLARQRPRQMRTGWRMPLR